MLQLCTNSHIFAVSVQVGPDILVGTGTPCTMTFVHVEECATQNVPPAIIMAQLKPPLHRDVDLCVEAYPAGPFIGSYARVG